MSDNHPERLTLLHISDLHSGQRFKDGPFSDNAPVER